MKPGATLYSGSLNKIMDEVTSNIKLSAREIGLEPLDIPDLHSKSKLIDLYLSHGVVSNVISVERYGDTNLTYKSGILGIRLGFKFSDLKADFKFKADVFGLNPDGNLTAVISKVSTVVEAKVDAIHFNASLSELLVPSIGDIKVDIKTTAPIYGEVMEDLINAVTTVFEEEIVYAMEIVVKKVANDFIREILNNL